MKERNYEPVSLSMFSVQRGKINLSCLVYEMLKIGSVSVKRSILKAFKMPFSFLHRVYLRSSNCGIEDASA